MLMLFAIHLEKRGKIGILEQKKLSVLRALMGDKPPLFPSA